MAVIHCVNVLLEMSAVKGNAQEDKVFILGITPLSVMAGYEA